jgi:glycerol-3-phosphate dehydrogenase
VVNAAGVYADVFHNMVSEEKIHITPRRGEYLLLDKSAGKHVSKTVFALPTKKGKGVLVSPTIHGNLLVGPTALDLDDKEATNTSAEGLAQVAEKASLSVKNLPLRSVITSFAGLRAHGDQDDFVLGEVSGCSGFFDCACIESPGLSAAPAIGIDLAEQIREKLQLLPKKDFTATRKDIVRPLELPREERDALIRENPAYGTIICRCEKVTEGEIIDAVTRPLGARSLDGVKRRTRAGMGRCQSGFCAPRVMEIIARERQIPITEITKKGGNSRLVTGGAEDAES